MNNSEKYEIKLNKNIVNDTPLNIYLFYEELIIKKEVATQEKTMDNSLCALLTSLTLLLNNYMYENQKTYEHMYKLLCIMSTKTDWNQKTIVDRIFETSEKIDKGNISNKMYQMFLYETHNLKNYSIVISSLLSMYNKIILKENEKYNKIETNLLFSSLIDSDQNFLKKINF